MNALSDLRDCHAVLSHLVGWVARGRKDTGAIERATVDLRTRIERLAVGLTGEGVSDPSNFFGNVGAPAKPTAVTVKK